jgi:uncharacterized membrane protein YgcG
VDYLVVGSSNASKLADAIADRGYSVHKIYYPNWRVDADNVEELLKMVREAIADKDPGTIIYQMLDNSCYYGRLRDGSRTAAKLGDDGSYHLEGEVTVCSKDTQLEHLNSIKPLLELAAKKKCLLLTPLPRYVAAGCCTNPEHCSNRRYPDFVQHMRDALELLRKHFKDFLYYRSMRHIKILDPGMDIRGLSLEEIWGKEAIHPTPLVYCRIAASVIKIAEGMEADANNKRRRSDSIDGQGRGGNNEQRGRRGTDPRQDGRYPDNNRGRGGWRGGRGGSSGSGMENSRGRRGGGGGGGRGDMYAY